MAKLKEFNVINVPHAGNNFAKKKQLILTFSGKNTRKENKLIINLRQNIIVR